MALLAAVRRKAAGGRGGIVLLGGDAGVGKSRLLREFEAQKASGASLWAATGCVEFVQAPLGPLRGLLQGLEHHGGAPRDAGTSALIERLTFERHAETTARAGGWLFESIDAAFARHALRGTVVLLIEDLHWADLSTLAFLSYLADRIFARRMLVVATYRCDELDRDPHRLGSAATLLSKEAVSDVPLPPLDERSTHVLVEQRLPHPDALDGAIVADIARRSQGNPFFAEELVKHALGPQLGKERQQLPVSIRSAVLARLGALAEGQRKILLLAAVLGERFSIGRLVAIAKASRDDVLFALERAQNLQLVYERHESPGEMFFRHALTCEVLYGELLGERVRPLHEAIGLELEHDHNRSAVSVELAHHWWRAGNSERAATYAELAGDQAFGIGAMADAISYYERALSVRKMSDAQTAGLDHKIGVALGALGRLRSGIQRLQRSGELYWASDDFEGFARNASALGALLYNAGETQTAIALYRRTIEALGEKLPAEMIDLLRARMGFDCVAALDFDSAIALVGEIAEPIRDPMTATHAFQTRFKVAAMRGDVERWRIDVDGALDAARRVGDNGHRLYLTHCQIALDAVALGEVGIAREHFERAISDGRTGYTGDRSLALAASSFEHTLRGDFSTAAALLEKAGHASKQSYAILVHVKLASFAIGICAGDVNRLRREDAESFLHYGAEHGMKLAMGLVGGPFAWALGVRGDVDHAAAWVHRFSKVVSVPHRFLFAFLAAAQFGLPNDVAAMRRMLLEATSRSELRLNRALLGLFDAFAAQRGIVDCDGRQRASEAADAFQAIGWPWLAARSFELAGESKRAIETYRTLGALGDLRRIEAASSNTVAGVLSQRERQIAELAGAGRSNDQIAELLHISPRTVEKHVSSALQKLQLRSRVQLASLLLK